jgi:hypothetical protein
VAVSLQLRGGFLDEHILQIPPVVELTPETRNPPRVSSRRQHLDIESGWRTMTIMGRSLCMIGVHKWIHKRNPDGGPYLECERCQKQQDAMSIEDYPGGEGGPGAH